MKSAPVALGTAPRLELEALAELNAQDLLTALHLPKFLAPWVRGPARRFAAEVRDFDEIMGRQGLVAAADFILARYTKTVDIHGQIPRDGPLVVASNHPGLVDAMALWRAIGREDLMIIAAEREFLDHLPKTRSRLIFVDPACPTKAIRLASDHLAQGGALLTFPAGRIEPDPALHPGAAKLSKDTWSKSLSLILRRSPAPTYEASVEGVISPAARKWVFWIRDDRKRDWAAATLQIACPALRKVHVKVRISG